MLVEEKLPAANTEDWPREVNMILSALEAGRHRVLNRRGIPRHRHRVQARLRLFSHAADSPPSLLYTRDVNQRGLGFITRHRLPLGYGGIVELATPFGGSVSVNCTVYRCRETFNGWFEGSLSFNREQWIFETSLDKPRK